MEKTRFTPADYRVPPSLPKSRSMWPMIAKCTFSPCQKVWIFPRKFIEINEDMNYCSNCGTLLEFREVEEADYD